MTLLSVILHLAAAVLLPPLFLGVIQRTKARVAGRRGAPLLQPWHDLVKLARKGFVLSRTTTWVFVAGELRVSGQEPGCELGERLRDQVDLLIEASDEGANKRERRWHVADIRDCRDADCSGDAVRYQRRSGVRYRRLLR